MKDKLVKLKRKCVALSVALGISLTGCGKTDDNYDTESHLIVFVDGSPYLTTAKLNFFQAISGVGTVPIYDVNTNEVVAKFSNTWELNENATFSNEMGSCVPLFSIIFCEDFINSETLSDETYNFLANNPEEVREYINENYLYDVNYCQIYKDDNRYTPLGIYEFNDEISNDVDYHLGYNANRLYESDYIYDIKDNKIYKKPDLGTCTFVPISDLYDEDKITANEAIRLMDEYLNNKSNNKIYVKD